MNSQSLADPGQLNADRLRFLDIARGLAVLGVIAVHTVQQFPTNVRPLDWWLGLGQFGVQLFFVISAYTMCMTLAARRHTDADRSSLSLSVDFVDWQSRCGRPCFCTRCF